MPHVYKAVYRSADEGALCSIKFHSELFFGFENHLGPTFDLELQKEIDKKVPPSKKIDHTLVKVEYDGFRFEDDRKSCIGHLLSAPLQDGEIAKKKTGLPRLKQEKVEEEEKVEQEAVEIKEKVKRGYLPKSIRVYLAIEDPDLLAFVSSLLGDPYGQYRVSGTASNVIAMLNMLQEWNSDDVLIAQFFSPAMAGYDTLRYMIKHCPPIKILSVGSELSRAEMRRYFIKGVLGSAITKEELHTALAKVSQGKIHFELDKRSGTDEDELVLDVEAKN